MLFDARAWFLLLTPTLLLAGCFISAEDRARGFDPDGDGIHWPNDCDNTKPDIGGEEVPYDGLDNDCDPATLDDDLDEDGLPITMDCDDLDPTQGGNEVCDGRDNDCDGLVDDDDPGLSDGDTWYADYDGDGDGDPDSMVRSCTRPADHVDNLDDCDDFDEEVQIGAAEVCSDDIDQDCDGETDGLGEMCDPGVPCTQGAACAFNGMSDFVCGCACPDEGYFRWGVQGISDPLTCALNYSPMTVNGTIISCPQEFIDAYQEISSAGEIIFTIDCDERYTDDLIQWHHSISNGKLDYREISVELYLAGTDNGLTGKVTFISSLLTDFDGVDWAPFTCSGIADFTFTYESIYVEYWEE